MKGGWLSRSCSISFWHLNFLANRWRETHTTTDKSSTHTPSKPSKPSRHVPRFYSTYHSFCRLSILPQLLTLSRLLHYFKTLLAHPTNTISSLHPRALSSLISRPILLRRGSIYLDSIPYLIFSSVLLLIFPPSQSSCWIPPNGTAL